MRSDPIVDEIRKIRDAHASRFGYDLKAICDDLRKKQEKGDNRIVSFPPRRLEKEA